MMNEKKPGPSPHKKVASLLGGESSADLTNSVRPPAKVLRAEDVVLPPIVVANDGVTEINIYADGKEELGRLLAPITHMPFEHPRFGSFQNLQGFWEWIKSEEKPDTLRYLSGHQAISLGRQLTKVYLKDFDQLILEANFCRIDQNERLRTLFLHSSLPFEMYYLKDPKDPTSLPIRPAVRTRMVECFTRLRTMMQHSELPEGFHNYQRPMSSR